MVVAFCECRDRSPDGYTLCVVVDVVGAPGVDGACIGGTPPRVVWRSSRTYRAESDVPTGFAERMFAHG